MTLRLPDRKGTHRINGTIVGVVIAAVADILVGGCIPTVVDFLARDGTAQALGVELPAGYVDNPANGRIDGRDAIDVSTYRSTIQGWGGRPKPLVPPSARTAMRS
jgi:hypothetical protein